MGAVSLKLARNYTNEKLSSLPSNAPTKTVTFDGGIYSVGNDVVNGQVSDIVIKGLTATNLVENGNFSKGEDGLDGWLFSNASGHATNNILFLTATKSAGGAKYNFINYSALAGHKLYIQGKIKSSSAGAQIFCSDGVSGMYVSHSGSNNFEVVSGIKVFDNSPTNASQITVRDNRSSDWTEIQAKEIFAIDLTATFGVGNEPTKEQCDEIFANWFDGTKSTLSNIRLNSISKNLFDGLLESGGYFSTNGKPFNDSTKVRNKKPVKVLTGKTVYFSSDGVSKIVNVNIYGDGGSQIAYYPGVNNVVVPSGAKTLNFWYTDTVLENKIQVEYDSRTAYEKQKLSQAYINAGGELRSLPNGVKDEFNVTTGVKTQRNGTKTNVNSGTVIDYADMATGGQFVAYAADGTSQVGVKGDTLTITAVSLTYQLATPIVTKLPAQAPLQVFENGTVYVEPIGDASESTLPSVEMTIPTGTSNKFSVATHDYGGAAADWVLTNSESKCFLLAVSSAGGAANIIAPNRPGTMYAISNASGQMVTVKISGGTGVAITNAKTVLVIHNGTDYTALTAEL